MENIYQNFLKNENEQKNPQNEEVIEINEEKKSKILFNEIIDDLIRKKTSKENMLKIQIEKNKKNLLEKFYSMSNMNNQNQIPNQQLQKNIIPNSNNNILEGQKEYDEIREKYKNERNKKKSSIFKSEDLHISNTNSVHLKKEDFSPINPNMVNQETKNNILIIQKKLFGDSEINEESSKVENIDEIDDLDFDDIDIKDFKNNNNNKENNNENNNNIINKMSNSNFNITNMDTNNINFELSSNINDNIEYNYFSKEILEKVKAIEYTYIAIKKNKKNEKLKDYKRQINRTKNYSVQLASKLDYYKEEEKDNKNKMNEMNNFIKNLNLMNPNMNNNININNINNNININNANLSEIISQQNKLNKNLKINNNYNINYNTNNNTTSTNNTTKTNNNISSSKKKNFLKEKNKNYKKIKLNEKPILNNIEINKINYRHISNSNLNKNKNNINQTYNSNNNSNNNKRKRKNNSVIINREKDKKEIFLINNNKKKETKTKINFYHYNTNNNNTNINHEINTVKNNNIKNTLIPSLYKNNPLTTKNKKIKMQNIIKQKNKYNNINISTGNKFSTLNTLQKNNNIKYIKQKNQIEVINRLKQQTYLGIYFIYADKIKDNFIFKGIYKKGVNDLNYVCNKIYSTQNSPICLNYEKFNIYIEDEKMDLIQTKLSSISIFNLNKSIILVKNTE